METSDKTLTQPMRTPKPVGQTKSRRQKLTVLLAALGAAAVFGLAVWQPAAANYRYALAAGNIRLAWGDSPAYPCIAGKTRNEGQILAAEKAKAQLESLVEIPAVEERARLAWARAACLSNQPEEAVEAYREYLIRYPQSRLAQVELGFALEAANQVEAALEMWDKAGLNATEFWAAGKQHLAAGNTANAILWFERAMLIDAGWAEGWIQLGDARASIQRTGKAILAWEEALKLGDERAIWRLVDALRKQAADDKLWRLYARLLEQFPEHKNRAGWWQARGDLLRVNNQWQEADRVYSDGLIEFPNNVRLLSGKAHTARQLRPGTGEGIRLAGMAIKAEPENGLGYVTLAILLYMNKNYKEAEGWFAQAIQRDATNRWWYHRRMLNANEGKMVELAVRIGHETVMRFPDFPEGYLGLARALIASRQTERAVKTIDDMLANVPQPGITILTRAAGILETANQPAKAYRIYQQILSLDAQNETAQKKLQSLTPEKPK